VFDDVLGNQLTLTTCNPRCIATTRLVRAAPAHSKLFPNSGRPVNTDRPNAVPKNQRLTGNSDVGLSDTLFREFGTGLVVAGVLGVISRLLPASS
jgi:hypothetical protein